MNAIALRSVPPDRESGPRLVTSDPSDAEIVAEYELADRKAREWTARKTKARAAAITRANGATLLRGEDMALALTAKAGPVTLDSKKARTYLTPDEIAKCERIGSATWEINIVRVNA